MGLAVLALNAINFAIIQPAGFFSRKKVSKGFKLVQGRLDLADPAKFLASKLNLLRAFEEALRSGYLLHPNMMRLLASNLHLIDDHLRDDPAAVQIFLSLLLDHGNPERPLRRMNELGVLSAFIPEFENIVAMMQFNVYHHYTVDEHIIQTISTLAQIERGELVEDLPLSSSILKEGVSRRVLYVALLLHDIGKGRPEDHSIIGAQLARRICPRLGLSAEETETVEAVAEPFLVRNGFMARTPRGRIATELGWRHLGRTPPAGSATLFDTPAPNA